MAREETKKHIMPLRPPEITRGKEIDLTGQVAIVTGGSHGIGRAIALKLGYHGAAVVINSTERSTEQAQEVLSELEALNATCAWVSGDIREAQTAEAVAKHTIDEFGQIDILVNNAGTTRDNLLMRMSETEWDEVIDTNLKGPFLMSRAVIKQMMMRQRHGSIINVSSISGQIGAPGQVNYSASKGGLEAMTAALAAEAASRNVRVNAVAAGFVDTPLTETLSDKQREAILSLQPLPGRIVPEDIAEAVLVLASDRSQMVTGQVYNVDGGTVRG